MNIDSLLQANAAILKWYSPYNFNRNISDAHLLTHTYAILQQHIALNEYVSIDVEGIEYIFIVKKLEWDTNYFGIPTYKLINVLSMSYEFINEATQLFNTNYLPKNAYCFMEVPAEDISTIQALGNASYKLIETRLTYYNNQLHTHNYPRYQVRQATKEDIPSLKKVAATMRNNFDRFHADKTFDMQIADNFLSTYIQNSVAGYANYVMVPNQKNTASNSFLTANYLQDDWDMVQCKISKMVLSAVSASTNKGWYIKLISEMTYHLRDTIGAECIYLNTQATNRAVFSTWEKLGYKLGNTTHVFSFLNK